MMKIDEVVDLKEDEMELDVLPLKWKKFYSDEELKYMKKCKQLERKVMAVNVLLGISIGILSISIISLIQAWRCI